MKRVWLATAVGLFVVASLLVSSVAFSGKSKPQSSAVNSRTILYYRDPMHPSYTSGKPGIAPDCGMALEPVYAAEPDNRSEKPPANVVRVTTEQQQMISLQTARVQRSAAKQVLRVPGRVSLDESQIFPLIASGEGYVTEILAGTTDSKVNKGQPLVTVYGRDYMAMQRMLLFALRASENPPPVAGDYQDQPALTLQEARLNLNNLGMSEEQIQKLTATRQVMLNVTLTSPASGIIIARNVFPKQKFASGTELFRIADLRKVWIVVDLFAGDSRFIQSGSEATVSIPGRTDLKFHAKVAEALPRFDGESRTLKLRMDVENPDLVLRPDMLVDVQFSIHLPGGVTVPADAVIDSGLRKIVFVDRGEGHFERRAIETGWRFGDQVQIVHGLNPGESVVVSGNFLLDSESQMQQGNSAAHD
jgi:RND family efflux transporter MFP subunit